MSADSFDSEVSFGKPKKRGGRPRLRDTSLAENSLAIEVPTDDAESGFDTLQIKPSSSKGTSKAGQTKSGLSFDNPEVR